MIQYFPIVTGSLTVLGNINVSGSITTSGSITISGSITSASFASTASFVENAQTASYVLNAVSSSFASTASFVALAQSASNAVSAATASFANTLTVAGNLTAQTLVVQTITSSVIYSSGSNVFGNSLANTQTFTGSVLVTGSITATEGNFLGSGVDGSLGSVVRISTTNTNGNARNWALVNTFDSYGDLNFRISTAQGGNALVSGSTILTLSRTGAATFTTTTGLGITITTNDVATLKMTNSAGSTKNWGFATTNTLASDFGIYQSTSNGGDPVSAGASRLYFNTSAYTKITNNGSLISRSAPFHEIYSSLGGNCLVINNANTTGAITSIDISYSGQTISDASSYFWIAYDTLQTKAVVYSNGTFGSRTNTYGSMSDIKLKENIVLATPKLEDLLKVNIVNFNFIDDTNKLKQIGVIAQELEQIFPNMIYETIDKVTGENSKNVKYSIFVPMLIKAIQELNTKFEEYKATHP